MSSYFGAEDIKIASVSGIVSIKASPFSGPITLTAVASASASIALFEIMVTLDKPSTLIPV